jgi:histidinol-phosphatase (PHP family)
MNALAADAHVHIGENAQKYVDGTGRAVSFGSDSHGPDSLAAHFPEAMLLVESFGFTPGRRSEDLWTR